MSRGLQAARPVGRGSGSDGLKERARRILERVTERGACTYQELSEWLGVSTMTIRRDVDELAAERLVIKVFGGVQAGGAPAYLYETALEARLAEHRLEKLAIAQYAVTTIADGATLFLDGSTTCLELARQLARERTGLTVATNSLLVALEAGRGRRHTVIVVGGQYDHDTGSCVGPESEAWASRFFVQQAFMSTKGFVPAEGTFESSLDNFRIKQIVARQCKSLTLLVDHSKFGQRALCKVLDSAQIHAVITDVGTPNEELERLWRDGKQVYAVASTSDAGARSAACQ